jgi:cytidyltransferase-like protein
VGEVPARRFKFMKFPIVLVNGCFDCLHRGHRLFLREATLIAAKWGAELIIGLNSDYSVQKLKGAGRPIETDWVRSEALQGWGRVEIFDGDSDALVQRVNADIVVRGCDQTISEIDKRRLVVIVPKLADVNTTQVVGGP